MKSDTRDSYCSDSSTSNYHLVDILFKYIKFEFHMISFVCKPRWGIMVKKVICVAPGHKKCRIFVFLSVAYLRFLFKGLLAN